MLQNLFRLLQYGNKSRLFINKIYSNFAMISNYKTTMNYHNKKFKPVQNTPNAETSEDTIFHYEQQGSILTCTYSGGQITKGQLIAIVDETGNIDMRYHQVNRKGELMTGICTSSPEIMANGKIRLHENWQWTSGDLSKGQSVLEEL